MSQYVIVSGTYGRRTQDRKFVISKRGETVDLTDAEAKMLGAQVRKVGDPEPVPVAVPHGQPLPSGATTKKTKKKGK